MASPNRESNNPGSDPAAAITAVLATTHQTNWHRSELSRLLYKPLAEKSSSSLSVIPWKILLQETSTEKNASNPKPLGATRTKEPLSLQATTTAISTTAPTLATKTLSELPSYLELRRAQNLAFADSQCHKAQQSSSSSNPQKAWKQALQLVPDHVPSLVGYGRHLLHTHKLQAAHQVLTRALSIDPHQSLAQELLSELQTKQTQNVVLPKDYYPNRQLLNPNNNNNQNLKTRESSAYQDALLERQLLASPKDHNDDVSAKTENSDSRRRRKHKRKKQSREEDRRRHQKRRHRRKYHSSDDDDDEASSQSLSSKDSRDSSSDRKRRKKRRKRERDRRKKRRKEHDRKHRRRRKTDSARSSTNDSASL